jgi:hypothetical protein
VEMPEKRPVSLKLIIDQQLAKARLTRTGDKVPMELPEYVWDGYVPTRCITLLVGSSGVGKSSFAAMLAARWSTGMLTGKPERVLMIMTEDTDETATIPRVEANGGDTSYVHVPATGKRWLFPRDIERLRLMVGETGAKIVILDQGLVGGITTQVGRQALDEVHELADELGLAVIFLHHFIKSAAKAQRVSDAIGGGYGIYGLPRSVLVLGHEPSPSLLDRVFLTIIKQKNEDDHNGDDKDDEEDEEIPTGERLVLGQEKHSFDIPSMSILYDRQKRIHPAAPDDPERSVAVFTEVRPVDYTPLQIMHAVPEGKLREVGKPREQAKSLILMLLAQAEEQGMRATELEGRVTAAGYSQVTVQRARTDLHREGMIEPVQTKDAKGTTTGWRWRLVVPDTIEE